MQFPSSTTDGLTYTCTGKACNCPGFLTTGDCWHMRKVNNIMENTVGKINERYLTSYKFDWPIAEEFSLGQDVEFNVKAEVTHVTEENKQDGSRDVFYRVEITDVQIL